MITARYTDAAGHFANSATAVNLNSTTELIAGNGVLGYSGDGGPATAAAINDNGLVIDSAGDVFFGDYGSNRVREINAVTHLITTAAGTGVLGFSPGGQQATAADLDDPLELALDSAGDLFMVEGSEKVLEVNAVTQIITVIAGTGTPNYNGDGELATAAWLNDPTSVAVDSAGNVFICDIGDNRIREVNAVTHTISTVAGTGTAGANGLGGPATAAQLDAPLSIAIDSAGDLFIANSGDNQILELSAATGDLIAVAGNGTAAFSGDGGLATAASLNGVWGVAVDTAGDIFFGEDVNDLVREVNGRHRHNYHDRRQRTLVVLCWQRRAPQARLPWTIRSG